MMISTRGRYALRVMIDLAEHSGDGYIAMRTVAERQDISLKYLEKILPLLVAEKMIEGVHGKGGGYKLTRSPSEYRVGAILRLTDGNLAPVACLECDAAECEKASECRTLPMWKELHKRVCDYLDGITLEELLNNGTKNDI